MDDHCTRNDLGGYLHAVAEDHHIHLAVVVVAAEGVAARFRSLEVDRILDRYILHHRRNIHNLRSRNPDILGRNIHHMPGPVPGPATPRLDEEVVCDCRTVSEAEDLVGTGVSAGAA